MAVTVNFESAIVPQWKDGTIRFKNVNVLRNPASQKQWMAMDRKANGAPVVEIRDDEVDANFTFYSVSIENVDVTLSLWRWLEGRGLVQNCAMKGVRGTIGMSNYLLVDDCGF